MKRVRNLIAILMAFAMMFCMCASFASAESSGLLSDEFIERLNTMIPALVNVDDYDLYVEFYGLYAELVRREMMTTTDDTILQLAQYIDTVGADYINESSSSIPLPSIQKASVKKDLGDGTYAAGLDLPAGSYKVTCIKTDMDDLGSAYTSLGNLYSALGAGDDLGSAMGDLGNAFGKMYGMTVEIVGAYGAVQSSNELKAGESISINLVEGTALKLTGGKCTVESVG